MATVMVMHWAGVTKEQYDAVRREVLWEKDKPIGGKYHVAWFQDDGLHALDVWESGGDFDRFVQQRLMPGVQKVGIKGEPKVSLYEAHATFAPNP